MNEKTVSLCIRCGKVTANLLKAAMVKALAKMEQEKKQQGQRTNQKQPQKEKEDKTYKGKQSLDKLMKQNVQLSNIEITDGNIKSFERVAKKYSIDFSLKKDVTADPPRYYVFFKARRTHCRHRSRAVAKEAGKGETSRRGSETEKSSIDESC